ncbi:MAG: serine acetyltransferase [Deltaproteobacteria bacterium]|nr:serine acetyltransferase [Deltaproteobacteria bacterium]
MEPGGTIAAATVATPAGTPLNVEERVPGLGGEERVPGLGEVVDALCGSDDGLSCVAPACNRYALPSRDVLIEVVEALRSVLFPGYYGTSELSTESIRFHVGASLDWVARTLSEQVRRGMCFMDALGRRTADPEACDDLARDVVRRFVGRLPRVRRLLATDVAAAYEGDPAATSPDEAVFCYPGISAITNHRIAHELHVLGLPLIPRIISEHAHSLTGIDIHPGATIGSRFFIDHGTGVVIGETTVIGDNVRIYQGVTLGAKSFPKDENGNPVKGVPRHPIVEDDVVIYSGATILGRVTIGRGSVVGGNVWLTHDVPPGSRISLAG